MQNFMLTFNNNTLLMSTAGAVHTPLLQNYNQQNNKNVLKHFIRNYQDAIFPEFEILIKETERFLAEKLLQFLFEQI